MRELVRRRGVRGTRLRQLLVGNGEVSALAQPLRRLVRASGRRLGLVGRLIRQGTEGYRQRLLRTRTWLRQLDHEVADLKISGLEWQGRFFPRERRAPDLTVCGRPRVGVHAREPVRPTTPMDDKYRRFLGDDAREATHDFELVRSTP